MGAAALDLGGSLDTELAGQLATGEAIFTPAHGEPITQFTHPRHH